MDEIDIKEFAQALASKSHACQCWKCKQEMKKMADLTIPQVFQVIREHSKYCSVCGGKLDLDKYEWHLPFCSQCRLKVIDGAAKAISANFEVAQNTKKTVSEKIAEEKKKKPLQEKMQEKKDDGW